MAASIPNTLYVAATIHAGTTIFGNVLGQVDGIFHAGELIHVWRSLRDNTLCGCGLPVRDCPVWQAIFEQAYGGFDRIDAVQADRLMQETARRIAQQGEFRSLIFTGKGQHLPALAELAEITGALYRAVQAVTGCALIVDTSKAIWYGNLLATHALADLHALHLVRDPRGVNYSLYRKHKARREPDHTRSPIRYAVRTSRAWTLLNLAAELVWRKPGPHRGYRRVRHEDFVAEPVTQLKEVMAFAGLEPGTLSFINGNSATIQPTHTVEGNRVRHQQGPVELRLDTGWISQTSAESRTLTTALTLPLLLRYNYPLFPAKWYANSPNTQAPVKVS
jgi:hypothetical protein